MRRALTATIVPFVLAQASCAGGPYDGARIAGLGGCYPLSSPGAVLCEEGWGYRYINRATGEQRALGRVEGSLLYAKHLLAAQAGAPGGEAASGRSGAGRGTETYTSGDFSYVSGGGCAYASIPGMSVRAC